MIAWAGFPTGAALVAAALATQVPPDSLVPVDRVVAVVGDTVILESEIQEQALQLQAMGARIPQDPTERERFLRDLLEQRIDDLVLLLHARKEGITVSDAEVTDAVDDRLARIRRRFPSETEFLRALQATGRTLAEFRLQLTQQVRNELLIQRYLQANQHRFPTVAVGEEEIRAFFEQQKPALGPKPPTISFVQIVVRPEPSDSAKAAARAEADRALAELRAGADFAVVARRYSDDAATRDEGGDLGWFRRGQMVRAFEEAAFALRPGELSGIVETPFGYHILRVDRVRGAERRARHILIRPELTERDLERATALADSLATLLRAGADPAELAARFGDPEEEAEVTGLPRDRLPPEYAAALADAGPGDVVGPFAVTVGHTTKQVVVRVTGVQPGGEWTLDDLRDQIHAQLQQQKRIEGFVKRLRERTYIEVRV
jgi:peptidyl-prolyl cis-trans isomerase SurA